MRSLLVALALSSTVVAACSSDGNTPARESGAAGAAPEARPYDPAPARGEGATGDGGRDGGARAEIVGGDGARDGGGATPCPALSDAPPDGARFAVALRSTAPKVLDGDLSDYRGCTTVLLDAVTAARVKGTPAATARIMIEWEPSALWIGAEIADALLEGDDPALPYLNDSLELFVSSAGYRTGDYGPFDHQYIIDHRGLAGAYSGGAAVGSFAAARVAVVPGGYRVEVRIDAVGELGAPLAKGDVRFFDAMLNDGVGQASFLVWAMQPHASCNCTACRCNGSPAFDTLLFAPLSLG